MEREEEETLNTPGVIEKYQASAKIANGTCIAIQRFSLSLLKKFQSDPRFLICACGQTTSSMKNSTKYITKNKFSRVSLSLLVSQSTKFVASTLLSLKIPLLSRKETWLKFNLVSTSMVFLHWSLILLLFVQTRAFLWLARKQILFWLHTRLLKQLWD